MRGLIGCWLLATGYALFAADGPRTLTMVNQCQQGRNETIVVGVNGGFVQAAAGNSCSTAGACPAGTTCLMAGENGRCFFDLPQPARGKAVLRTGERVTYVLNNPALPNASAQQHGNSVASNIKWSGNIYARTHCDSAGGNCATAVCSANHDACPSGVGPQGPVSLAEFTFATDGVDFYDISIINGVNIPISMGPTVPQKTTSDPYFCQSAGAPANSATGLQACTWRFNPLITLNGVRGDQSKLLRAVVPCSGPNCPGLVGRGLVFGSTSITQMAGRQVGWWSADELCVYSGNAFGAPVNCTAKVPGQGQNVDLYQCNGANPNSCYNKDAASATCCGAADWVVNGRPLKQDMQRFNSNPQWTSIAQPWAGFLKNACPTAYSYPFDDSTSTFTCQSPNTSGSVANTMNYTITFCPGGNDGLMPGIPVRR